MTLAVVLCASAAHAETVADKLCIFAAAQKLPAIPGMAISASRMKDVPADLQAKNASNLPARLVEIDVKAAAQDATFTFICVSTDKVGSIVTPVGMAR